jgi:hypothetical protein
MIIFFASALGLILGLYLAIGLVFAIPFAFNGAGKIDPTAREATLGFKIIIIPGAMALWPLLVRRWLKGVSEPPEEKNPHRAAARQSSKFETGEGNK